MTPDEQERDAQARAEIDRDAGRDAAADRYRVVYRSIRSAPAVEPPADFAAHMAALLADEAEPRLHGTVETWGVRLALAGLGAAALGYAAPLVVRVDAIASAPWPLLIGAGVAAAAVWMLGRVNRET